MTEITPRHGATLIFEDMNPLFIKLAKRLNQLSRIPTKGLSVISLTLFMIDGEPILWLRPEVNNLATSEPKGCDDRFIESLKNMHK